MSDEAITAGQPVTIQCTVSEGDLPIHFRWSFHGQELSSQMGISTVRLNSRVSLLSIDSIAAGHAGDYTCTAQNSAGSVNHTATLLVQGQRLEHFSSKTPENDFLQPKITGRSAAIFFQQKIEIFPPEGVTWTKSALNLIEFKLNLMRIKCKFGLQWRRS